MTPEIQRTAMNQLMMMLMQLLNAGADLSSAECGNSHTSPTHTFFFYLYKAYLK
jgi:hypothetical protein